MELPKYPQVVVDLSDEWLGDHEKVLKVASELRAFGLGDKEFLQEASYQPPEVIQEIISKWVRER